MLLSFGLSAALITACVSLFLDARHQSGGQPFLKQIVQTYYRTYAYRQRSLPFNYPQVRRS